MAPADVAFFLASAFLFGVFLAGQQVPVGWACASILVGIGLIYAVRPSFRGIVPLLVFLLFSAGFFYYHFYGNWAAGRGFPVLHTPVTFLGVVRGEPAKNSGYTDVDVSAESPFKGSVRVRTASFPEVQYGDRLRLSGIVEPPAYAGAKPLMPFPEVEIHAEHQGSFLKEKLLKFKTSVIGQFHRALPAESAALLGGLTLGVREEFTPEFKSQMAQSGTTHLVALSGYNIALVALAISSVLGCWLRRRTTFYLTLAAIFLFVLMVGGEASVVRAAIMGALVLLAREVGRAYSFRNAVALTAAGMVIGNPTLLPSHIGFQLSFLSLLGIVYAGSVFARALGVEARGPGVLGWRENLATTLGAQLAVLPVLVTQFGGFSFSSLLANLLILGVVPLTMFLGFALAIAGFLFSPFAAILAVPLELLLQYERGVIALFAEWRIPVGNFLGSPFLVALYYLAFAGFISFIHERDPRSVTSPGESAKEKNRVL